MKTLERPLKVHVVGDAYWVGTNIHRLRKRMKLTQETLAQAADISPRRLRDIEAAGEGANPTLKTLGAIAKVLGVEAVKLFRRRREAGFKV